jgi:cystathionine gamma-synthase
VRLSIFEQAGNMKPETQAIHAGQHVDPATGAVIAPIHLSTTFEREGDGSYPLEYVYTRSENPNRAALEANLCALEGGAAAAAFASGSAAAMTLLQALSAGDHLIAPDNLYFGVRLVITEIMGRWGLAATFVDMTDLDAVQQAVQPNTRLILIETPSNPLIKSHGYSRGGRDRSRGRGGAGRVTTPSPRRSSSARSNSARIW